MFLTIFSNSLRTELYEENHNTLEAYINNFRTIKESLWLVIGKQFHRKRLVNLTNIFLNNVCENSWGFPGKGETYTSGLIAHWSGCLGQNPRSGVYHSHLWKGYCCGYLLSVAELVSTVNQCQL